MDPVEESERAAVIAEAMTWLKTPWRHQEEEKGVGVDCAQFVRRVFLDVGVVAHIPHGRPYPSQWALHRDDERILDMARTFAIEVDRPQAADIVLWQFGRCYSHCGIMIDDERVIHAYVKTEYVDVDYIRSGHLSMRGALDPRPVKFFDAWAGRRARLPP